MADSETHERVTLDGQILFGDFRKMVDLCKRMNTEEFKLSIAKQEDAVLKEWLALAKKTLGHDRAQAEANKQALIAAIEHHLYLRSLLVPTALATA